ncbi:hypothetical protein SAMN06265348_106211 [Pedobacter westerhofensis]|uniref:CarboxypepD_reg-like domain-containing protein n=1 Tax=Pedobacter westerhofensis TaxID=425512 RepID=A0A521DUP5_9SPHI|nr:hypothetical protein [Pedobacter westerhofensis]SMO75434.1 hypothetical protein SAMN06265348_106211 [Pedobacter westerhofensis]
MKLFILLFFITAFAGIATAQKKSVQGFVIDKESKQRLAKVYIYNSHDDEGMYNNNKGEFATQASVGDTLFAALEGYGVDTLIYKGNNAIYFQLKPLAIQLREVAILGSLVTPKERYDQNLREYKYATDRGSSKDLLNLNSRGAGLGIDAIYNLLSRKGRNARHLQAILERDYKEQVIDYRYNPAFVGRALRIKGFELQDYMQQYRPSYDFVLMASDYAFIVFLRNNYASYKRNPRALRLKPLPQIKIDHI